MSELSSAEFVETLHLDRNMQKNTWKTNIEWKVSETVSVRLVASQLEFQSPVNSCQNSNSQIFPSLWVAAGRFYTSSCAMKRGAPATEAVP